MATSTTELTHSTFFAPSSLGAGAGSVSSDDPDFSLALADLLGGGMFINTVILGAVILCSTVEVDKRPFRRDFLMVSERSEASE